MYYLTVVLSSSIMSIIYYIMLFTHARENSLSVKRLHYLSSAFFFTIIFAQSSLFVAVESFKINEWLSGLFCQLFLQLFIGVIKMSFGRANNTYKKELESEKVRLFIRDLDANSLAKSEGEKVDNGTILQHRDGENSTKGGLDFDGASELTVNAKKKSSTSIDKECALKAEHLLDRVKKGEITHKREVENAIDSLIKIVSSKK